MRFLSNFSLRGVLLALAVVSCFVLVSPMQAALINPPDPFFHLPDPFTGCTGCTFLASLAPQTVDGTDIMGKVHWTAILNTAVFSDPGTGGSPFGTVATPTLDFFYQLENLPTCTGCTQTPDNIGRFTATSFIPTILQGPGLLVDVGINFGAITNQAPGTGFDPAGIAMPGTVDRVAPGDTIGWNYSAPGSVNLTPGTTSIIMEVATNATLYTHGTASALDGGTGNFSAFAPASPVPEPASALLIGLGMLGLASLRRSRRT